MRRVVLFILLAVLSTGVVAQTRAERKAARKAKKEAKFKDDQKRIDTLMQMVESKQFVLEATTLYDKRGAVFQIGNTLNFVRFDVDESTIQLAFNHIVGWNGVGGITLDGKIGKMEIKRSKKHASFTINATVVNKGRGGLVTMIFSVSPNSRARVDMSGSFGSRLSFEGYLVPLSESNVYKGMTNY